MLIIIALVAGVLLYFSTPWVAVPLTMLSFVTLRAIQFRTLLYTREDVGPYEALRQNEYMRAAYGDCLPPGMQMQMSMQPRASAFFSGVVIIFVAYLWRYFLSTSVPVQVLTPNKVFFLVAFFGAFSVWTQAPSVGMTRGLGFAVASLCIAIPGIRLLLGFSLFGN